MWASLPVEKLSLYPCLLASLWLLILNSIPLRSLWRGRSGGQVTAMVLRLLLVFTVPFCQVQELDLFGALPKRGWFSTSWQCVWVGKHKQVLSGAEGKYIQQFSLSLEHGLQGRYSQHTYRSGNTAGNKRLQNPNPNRSMLARTIREAVTTPRILQTMRSEQETWFALKVNFRLSQRTCQTGKASGCC